MGYPLCEWMLTCFRLSFALFLFALSVIVPCWPAWIHLHMKLTLLSGLFIVFGLLFTAQTMPLKNQSYEQGGWKITKLLSNQFCMGISIPPVGVALVITGDTPSTEQVFNNDWEWGEKLPLGLGGNDNKPPGPHLDMWLLKCKIFTIKILALESFLHVF